MLDNNTDYIYSVYKRSTSENGQVTASYRLHRIPNENTSQIQKSDISYNI